MGEHVSIVVVAYDCGAQLERCLRALHEDDPTREVIVVDNGTPSAELQATARALQATVVTPPENLGFAAGCNVGARVATGDVLVFLNPDTVPAPGAVGSLVAALADESVGIAMGRLRLLDRPSLLQSAGTAVHVTGLGWSDRYGEPASAVSELTEVAAPCGAAMALRADVFAELGGFRNDYFLYMEDVELGWRTRMTGRRVVLVPEANVYHDYDFERNGRKRYFMERNRVAFLVSAFALRTLLLLMPLLVATEIAMVAIALRQGWLRDKLASWGWLVRNARTLARHRRATQRLRRVPDRRLVSALTARVDPAMLRVPLIVTILNPIVVGYWALARRVL